MKNYDVVVLGAGPGGYVAAIRAAQLGAKTAIIEKEHIGGTCLNVGCIPTKALLKNADILHDIELGRKRGIKIKGELELDYSKAVKAKDKAVKQLVSGVTGLLASNEIDTFYGNGKVNNDGTIQIEGTDGSTEQIEYGKLIIATGSRPALPPIPGIETEGVMTSTEILAMKEVPEELIIIGAGVIGCEFASVFSAYGSSITMIEMLDAPVAILDEIISENMAGILESSGIDLKTGCAVKAIAPGEDGKINVAFADKAGEETVVSGDKVLVSIGRKPNTEGLEDLGLEMNRAFIQINDKLETSVENVYAIGDVTGKKQLAHVASEQGVIAAENAMGAENTMEYDIVPSCIYTIPEVASVGMSEKEAKEAGIDYIVGTFPLVACGKAVATAVPDGVFKLLAEKDSRKIIGAHLIGHSSTELVAEVAAYMKMNATIDDVVSTIHAHPTIAEGIAEAARNFDGNTIHMPKQR